VNGVSLDGLVVGSPVAGDVPGVSVDGACVTGETAGSMTGSVTTGSVVEVAADVVVLLRFVTAQAADPSISATIATRLATSGPRRFLRCGALGGCGSGRYACE